MRSQGIEPSTDNPIQLPGGYEWDGSSNWNIGTELVITGDIDLDGMRDAVMRHSCDWGSANSGFIEEPLTLYLSSKMTPQDVECYSDYQEGDAEIVDFGSSIPTFIIPLVTKDSSLEPYWYECAIWYDQSDGQVVSGDLGG
jgi:hypothetical protein